MFFASFDEKRETGYIKVIPGGITLCYGEKCNNPAFFNRYRTCTFSKSTMRILPEDFTIIPRDPKSYIDFQAGDLLSFNKDRILIEFRMGRVVIGIDDDGNATMPYTCNELFDKGYRLMLTEIEDKIKKEEKSEEKEDERFTFEDGDFCYLKTVDNHEWLFIKMGSEKDSMAYAAISKEYGRLNYNSGVLTVVDPGQTKILRKATNDEVDMMENILKKNNLCWNNNFKRMENVQEYKDCEPVLVRNQVKEPWKVRIFKEYVHNLYKTYPDNLYRQCLPMNKDTFHLACKSECLI